MFSLVVFNKSIYIPTTLIISWSASKSGSGKDKMIQVEEIEEILKLTLLSAYLKDEQPLSLIIAASPESGKTCLLSKQYRAEGVMVFSDATAFGIIKATDNLKDIEKGDIRHIIIPDLVTPLTKRYETSNTFIAFLNALIEEGLVSISTYATSIPSREIPVKCGLITAVTPEYLEDRRHGWMGMGFLSRMLPVSYAYSDESKEMIFDFIQSQNHLNTILSSLNLPPRDATIELNEGFAAALTPYVKEIVKPIKGLYGFRLQRQLQTLLKASAFSNNRDEVNSDDIEKIVSILKYVNFDYKEI